MKLQFQAPPQAGKYTFVMHLISDSYIGMDAKREATLVVEDSTKAVEIESDDEISEPGEGENSSTPYSNCVKVLLTKTIYRFPSRPNVSPKIRWSRRSSTPKIEEEEAR